MRQTRPEWRIQDSWAWRSFSERRTQQRDVRMVAGMLGGGA